MEIKKIHFIKKVTLMRILGFSIALIGAFILFPIYFEAMIYPLPANAPLWTSLDPSWLLHMNYINYHEMVWGKDIAYTYGPLAYLSTKVGWGQQSSHFLLYDMFIGINYFLILYHTFILSKSKIITIAVFIAFIIVFPVWVGSSNAVILMALLLFWIRKSIDSPNIIYYIFQTIILGLIFFIKFNTGLIAFPLFLAGIGYNIVQYRKDKKKLIIVISFLLAPFVLIFLMSGLLNVALYEYVIYGIEMVAGYNDIMYMDHPLKNRGMALLIIGFTTIILLHKLIVERQERLKNVTILFIYSVSFFVLYKQGFVRGMEIDFFIFSIMLIISVYDLHSVNYRSLSSVLVLAATGISLYFVFYIENQNANLSQKLNKLYVTQYKNFSNESGLHLHPNTNQLPDSIKKLIGRQTVDVYPWNVQMLWENNLNYSPRPAFQSHSTYTKKMEELNFNFYNSSEKAPEYVLYDFAAVDGRYPLFDEPKLNLIYLRNYVPAEVFTFQERKILLLKKKRNYKPITLTKVNEYAIFLNAGLEVKKDVFYEVTIYNNILGTIKGIIDHAPEIQLEIHTGQPAPYTFRTSKKLLESGVFSDRYFSSTEDFANFFTQKEDAKNEIVKYYVFRAFKSKYFKDKVKITEYKIREE